MNKEGEKLISRREFLTGGLTVALLSGYLHVHGLPASYLKQSLEQIFVDKPDYARPFVEKALLSSYEHNPLIQSILDRTKCNLPALITWQVADSNSLLSYALMSDVSIIESDLRLRNNQVVAAHTTMDSSDLFLKNLAPQILKSERSIMMLDIKEIEALDPTLSILTEQIANLTDPNNKPPIIFNGDVIENSIEIPPRINDPDWFIEKCLMLQEHANVIMSISCGSDNAGNGYYSGQVAERMLSIFRKYPGVAFIVPVRGSNILKSLLALRMFMEDGCYVRAYDLNNNDMPALEQLANLGHPHQVFVDSHPR